MITIYNKPETENSGAHNDEKYVLSEGRAAVIGKKFTFDNGNISRVPEAGTFQSLTVGQMQKIKQDLGLEDGLNLENQRRKMSNHLEYYNQIETIIERDEWSKYSDPRKLFDKKQQPALITVRGDVQDCINPGIPQPECQNPESLHLTLNRA